MPPRPPPSYRPHDREDEPDRDTDQPDRTPVHRLGDRLGQHASPVAGVAVCPSPGVGQREGAERRKTDEARDPARDREAAEDHRSSPPSTPSSCHAEADRDERGRRYGESEDGNEVHLGEDSATIALLGRREQRRCLAPRLPYDRAMPATTNTATGEIDPAAIFGPVGRFEFSVIGRQYPDSTEPYDKDWLIVRVKWVGQAMRVNLTGPFVLAGDLRGWADGLVEMADALPEGKRAFGFLEPSLAMECEKIDRLGHFMVAFDLQGQPAWGERFAASLRLIQASYGSSDGRCNDGRGHTR